RAGKHIVRQLREGKLKPDDLPKLGEYKAGDVLHRVDTKVRKGRIDRDKLLAMLAQARAEQGDAPPPRRAGGDEQLEDVKRRQAGEDQRTAALVDDAVRGAARLLQPTPDAARALLKRTRDSIVDNPDISERARRALSDRLRAEVRNVEVRGV